MQLAQSFRPFCVIILLASFIRSKLDWNSKFFFQFFSTLGQLFEIFSRLKGILYDISLQPIRWFFSTWFWVENNKKKQKHPNTKLLPIFNGRNKRRKTKKTNTKFLPVFNCWSKNELMSNIRENFQEKWNVLRINFSLRPSKEWKEVWTKYGVVFSPFQISLRNRR